MAQEEHKEAHTAVPGGGLGGGVRGKAHLAAVGVDGGGYSYASVGRRRRRARASRRWRRRARTGAAAPRAAFDAMLDPEWEGEADPPADVLKVVHEDSD